tara:strand:+ start:950 stop:1468 length:519 start_codon:yes stop_codon:yes gene_type:complete
MVKKAIFLDRDGVINKSITIKGKPKAPLLLKDFKYLPKVPEAVEILKKKYILFIVTNQPDLKSKKLNINKLSKMHLKIKKDLNINYIFFCPHTDEDNCKCRKPKNSLIEKAIKKYKINRKDSYLIGDRKKDIDAGIKSKLKTIYIESNYKERKPIKFNYKCDSLFNALKYIK